MSVVLDWLCDLIATYGVIPVALGLTVTVLAAWLGFWAAVDAISRRQARNARDWRTDVLEHTTPTPDRKETEL
ncbi:hypothetical protein [Streptomyces sp. SID8499]|uniref:hypothetical protein n=1 Tax=Streptomyces sp. SID8499 TaxID=2706106 RepID=UPI0013CDCFD1|nr:hypothetical protein [Streptomyces sp. SID8499]NED31033.1 hypothetical protein [Streptomyces sp. SID8499]